MTTDPTPELCCTHGAKLDQILELLEDRKAKREPADGVYRVRIPESSRVAAYWVQRQIDEQRAADERDANSEREVENQEPPKYATGGFVEVPAGAPLIAGIGVDCVFPFNAGMVRVANPSTYIDHQAVADTANQLLGDDQ